jgi:transposase
MVAASAECAVAFSLSAGNVGDAPEGRKLLDKLKNIPELWLCNVLMDRAYEGNETRELVFSLNFYPVVPPKKNRLEPWAYDEELYKKRNEVERLFRRLKGFRRIFTRYDKLDLMFMAFVVFAFITEALIR